jgi:hypothetical protein
MEVEQMEKDPGWQEPEPGQQARGDWCFLICKEGLGGQRKWMKEMNTEVARGQVRWKATYGC